MCVDVNFKPWLSTYWPLRCRNDQSRAAGMYRDVRDRSPAIFGRYVVVGISNSVLSILTGNFPVRIDKKKFV